MYQVFIVNNYILSRIGFDCSNEQFKQLAKEHGLTLSLKEFETYANSGCFNSGTDTLRILKPTKK